MPGAYLLALAISFAGVIAIDLRWRLALGSQPWRTLIVVGCGLAVFIAWDLIGIASGVFRQGEQTWYIGVDLAPHLPLEEIVFLAFLNYLALVIFSGFLRWRSGRTQAAS